MGCHGLTGGCCRARPAPVFAVCVGVKWIQLVSLCSQNERKGREGENRGCSPQSVPAEQRSSVGLSAAAEPVSVELGDGLIRLGVIVQLRLHTGAGRHRGVEVERKRTPKRPQRRKGGR